MGNIMAAGSNPIKRLAKTTKDWEKGTLKMEGGGKSGKVTGDDSTECREGSRVQKTTYRNQGGGHPLFGSLSRSQKSCGGENMKKTYGDGVSDTIGLPGDQ